MARIKLGGSEAALIEMLIGMAIDAGVKWATGRYKQIMEAEEEERDAMIAELDAKRKARDETIINL
jgi:hypothetical protein